MTVFKAWADASVGLSQLENADGEALSLSALDAVALCQGGWGWGEERTPTNGYGEQVTVWHKRYVTVTTKMVVDGEWTEETVETISAHYVRGRTHRRVHLWSGDAADLIATVEATIQERATLSHEGIVDMSDTQWGWAFDGKMVHV